MTAATLAHLPLQVGGVALAHAGRVALWVVRLYMRSPLTNSAIAALVVTTAMAGSNALFGQRHEHPAPLFGPVEEITTGSIEPAPVIPKTRPKSFATGAPVKLKTAEASEPAGTPEGPIGNKDVFEVQRKLEQLQFFTGTIDGYYGPQTARAIRKFEEQRGLKPTGMLTRETMDLIISAPIAAPVPQPAPVAPLQAKPAATVTLPMVKDAPVEEDLPAPERVKPQSLAAIIEAKPLSALTPAATAARAAGPKLLGRPVPQTPEQALEMAADTAEDAIDTIINGVQSMAMTTPPKPAAEIALRSTPQARATVTEAPIAIAPKAPEPQQLAALPEEPQVGVPLNIEEEAPKPGDAIAVLDTDATPDEVQPISVTDPVVVAKVQRGLASLGFLHGPADGVAGEATAKAIRNFEVYFNYKVTGRITPELLDLLTDNGAVI